jgi:uncharacterized membrane protein YeaQ/YmgE (transglycosylase-associated protein family)
MEILAWVGLGLVAGILAKFFMPGNDPGGIVVTILLGIAGAVLGGFISDYLGFGDVRGFDAPSLLIAIGGAMLLLFGYRMAQGK